MRDLSPLISRTISELESSTGGDVLLCKFNCGRPVRAGLTKRGTPFDACCRSCELNTGLGLHDPDCGGRGDDAASEVKARPACPRGSRCKQRDAAHLAAMAHPLDEDYALACAMTPGVKAERLSLKVLFDWTDTDGSGKLSRQELGATMDVLQEHCGGYMPPLTEAAWRHLDEDGNGVVNFNEFASWAGPRSHLPLGLDKRAFKEQSTMCRSCPCRVLDCPCENFEAHMSVASIVAPRRRMASVIRLWGGGGKKNLLDLDDACKVCRHKKRLHEFCPEHEGEVPIPEYWKNRVGDFNDMVAMGEGAIPKFQRLLDATYSTKLTRDRKVHNPTIPQVPKGFRVVKVERNENSANWREYSAALHETFTRIREGGAITPFQDVGSTVAWKEIDGAKAGRLQPECNEWYLFHGTNPNCVRAICDSDFIVGRAGSNTGTLYGKGLYFAESITKADEYASPDDEGHYAVLLCRVLGGNVRYTDELDPDPEDLVYSCIEGKYNCVIGDRRKTRGTYREFVLFDSENVYPEYVIQYQRVYR